MSGETAPSSSSARNEEVCYTYAVIASPNYYIAIEMHSDMATSFARLHRVIYGWQNKCHLLNIEIRLSNTKLEEQNKTFRCHHHTDAMYLGKYYVTT